MITLQNGHWRSIRTKEEDDRAITNMLAGLQPDTREAVERILEDWKTSGTSSLADTAAEELWEVTPVPIEEWLDDPRLSGDAAMALHPILRDDMIELFQEPFFSERYNEIIFTGALGVGKSQAHGSIVQSSRGVLEIQELIDGDLDFSLHSESGTRRATYREDEGKKRAIKLTLHSGSWVESTPHHRYRVLDPSFAIVWKRADEIQAGDYLVKKPGADLWGSRTEVSGRVLTPAFATLIGLWVAEGWYIEDANNVLICSGEGRETIQGLLSDAGIGWHWNKYERGADYFSISGPCAELIREHIETGSGNKRIPLFIREAPKEIICAFLRGYFGGDAHVNCSGRKGNGHIELSSKSRRLIDQTQHILWCLGIRSRVTPKIVNEKTYWRLHITHKWSKIKFRDQIGFCFERKQQDLEDICDERVYHRDNDRDIIPFAKAAWRKSKSAIPEEYKTKKHSLYKTIRRTYAASEHTCPNNVTYKAVRAAAALSYGPDHIDPLLRSIVEEDLWFDPVADIERDRSTRMYDFTVEGDPSYVANGVISHNTFWTSLCIMRICYELLCLKCPQTALGLAPSDPLYIIPVSRTKELARRVAFGQIAGKLNLSPFFRPRMRETKEEICFPEKRLFIMGGSSNESHALGMNVVAAFVDEGNFFNNSRGSTIAVAREEEGYDKARTVYEALARRIKSRFERVGVSGMMFLVSSKRGFDDFTERRIRAAQKSGNPSIFVRDYASWQVRPDAYTESKWYRMAFSQVSGRNRYLLDEEDPIDDEILLKFPEEFKGHFDLNAMGAAQDYGGVSFESADTFFTNREVIDRMMEFGRVHPFESHDWRTDQPLRVKWDLLVSEDMSGQLVPLCCPNAVRHVHIDISKNQCATGFCIGHRCGTQEVMRVNPETNELQVEDAPVIHIDFVLRIVAPPGGEIEHSKVRGIVALLMENGINIRSVTMDRYCSTPNLQQFERMGLKAKELSTVMKLDPYLYLRTAAKEGRVQCPEYPLLKKELKALVPSPRGDKVEKGVGVSKDLADALAGVVYWLAEKYKDIGPLIPSKGKSEEVRPRSGWSKDGDYQWADENTKEVGEGWGWIS